MCICEVEVVICTSKDHGKYMKVLCKTPTQRKASIHLLDKRWALQEADF
jgi:hypothetical protein